ncbi:MAG: hypothetical protein GY884_13555 [Proteobacteria bacterium]|nr:hypothetical protein [Pseudomonadota bacterium]
MACELRANAGREIESVRFHRVIDNAPITLSGDDLWIALNYQLIHLVDFLPVANWAVYANDTSFILFRDLYDLMEAAGKRDAQIGYTPARGGGLVGEKQDLAGWLSTHIPVGVSEKMAAKSVTRFPDRIGHSLDYSITWAS